MEQRPHGACKSENSYCLAPCKKACWPWLSSILLHEYPTVHASILTLTDHFPVRAIVNSAARKSLTPFSLVHRSPGCCEVYTWEWKCWVIGFADGAQLWQIAPVFESTCTIVCSQKPYMGDPFPPYLSNHLVLSVSLILAILVGFSDNTLQ